MNPDYTIPADLDRDLQRVRMNALWIGVVSVVLCLIGSILNPAQFFRSWLWAVVFYVGLSVGCMAILMMQYLSGGAWGLVIRRVCEAVARTLPLLALLFVPIAFGIGSLYVWSHSDVVARDEILQHKHIYLNVPFFLIRAVFYFAVWIVLGFLMNKWSAEHDRTGDLMAYRKLQIWSGPGLALYAFTVTFASFDWLMSLDPHWYSTIFGVLVMGGQGLSAMAFIVFVMVLLSRRPPLLGIVGPAHLQDLGKLLFTFVMLWAYFSFSQLLIVWAGNLTEEIPWYLQRLNGGWQYIGGLLIIFHFALPFALLLSRTLKRAARTVAQIAALLLAMRFVDCYWLVAPDFNRGFHLSWMDFAAPIGIGGLWTWMFIGELRKRPLLPLRDPHLEEAIEHGRAHEFSY